MIVVGIEPFAIDITSILDGVDVGSATARAVSGEVLGAPCRIISLEDYRASKAASGRPKDLADLALLDEVNGSR